MPQTHSLRHKSDAYSVLAYLMLLDPIRHRAGKLGQAALGKGGFHSGAFGQLGTGCHTGHVCLLYTSDVADAPLRVDLGASRTINKKNFTTYS